MPSWLDTTERLRFHAEISAQISDAIVATDNDLRVTYWNRHAERVYGVQASAALGQRLDSLYKYRWLEPSDERAAWTAIEAEGRWRGENVHVRADGVEVHVESSVSILRDERGTRIGLLACIRDITDRRAMETRLLQSANAVARLGQQSEQQRRLYETILSNTPDFVYVWGLDHRFAYANRALLEMWGKTWDEAIGRHCLELGYEPWHAEMHDREIDQVIATRLPVRGEVPFTGTNGRRIYDYILVPVIGDNGQVEAVAGTTRDVTDRRQAEDAIRESERRLADANRAKDEFLATLSHELRTPLNALLGWAHMLRSGSLGPEQSQRALDSLERNAKVQAQLVNDLLDVSRIVSGKLPLKSEAVDLGTVVSGAVDAVRPGLAAKRLRLRLGLDGATEMRVCGDADRLQQIVWNLLSNAVKFTPEGGKVDVDLTADASSAIISVRDSGEGIDPAFLPHVFERFRQGDGAPSRVHGGLGLGLAIVRHLAEAHGGTVAAYSDGPGRGSTFVVRIPR